MPQPNWVPEIMYEESNDGTSSQIPFIMVPAGAITLIGLKQPEFFGILCSVKCSIALNAADHATPSLAFIGHFAWGEDPL